MILITTEEYKQLKEILGDEMPFVAVSNKNKSGSRKKHYIEEDRRAMKVLKTIRNGCTKGAKN